MINGAVELLSIVNFESISSDDFPEVSAENLSELTGDQRYLVAICQAVISGKVPEWLVDTKIGPLNMTRWNTT